MKRVLTVLTLAFGVCVASAADLVIYVVDMAQAYQSYYKTKQVQQQLASAVDVTNNELKAMDEKRVKLIAELQEIEKKIKRLGTPLESLQMTLSFMSLLVIPALKLSDKGLFDGERCQFTSLFI